MPKHTAVRELAFVIAGAGLLTVVMTIVKVRYVPIFQGDSAMFFQMMQNLLHTGIPTSQIGADIQAFLETARLQALPAAAIAKMSLAPPPIDDVNMLSWHAYYVYYLLAPFCAIFPIRAVLLASFVLSFVGVLAGVYLFARAKGVPLALSLGLALLVLSHPGWWASLLWGQFYPDRIFVLAEFALMAVVSLPKAPRWLIVALAVLSASITERAPLVAGLSVLLYVLLWWRRASEDRGFKVCVAVALLAYGLLVLTVFIHNPYNTHYFPSSMNKLAQMVSRPYFTTELALMFVACAPLLILAGFEWPALLIALVAMIPNVFGTVGGAEKIGWVTHYSSYYLPILIWAAVMGLSSCVERYSIRQRRYVLAGMCVALVMVTFFDPFSFSSIRLVTPGPTSAVLPATIRAVESTLGAPGAAVLADGSRLAQVIPSGSRISSIEAGMPYVYRDGVVHLFPIGIDTTDYAILRESIDAQGQPAYSGAVSRLGADEVAKIDDVLLARMRRDGYDMAHPIEFPVLGLAVFKRT